MGGFPQYWERVRRLIRRSVLDESLARDIVRKGGIAPGDEGQGLPPGGRKGRALVKKSDADYDARWTPNGPYTYDWNDFSDEGYERGPDGNLDPDYARSFLRGNSGPPMFACEPVPVATAIWQQINMPLRSGTSNQSSLGFKFDAWKIEESFTTGSVLTGSWFEPDDSVTEGPFEFAQLIEQRSMIHNQAPREFRLQLYVTQASSSAVISFIHELYATGPSEYVLAIPGAGYYSSGWQLFDQEMVDPFPIGGVPIEQSYFTVRLKDDVSEKPAVPFCELQVRTWEFPPWFDWMYER